MRRFTGFAIAAIAALRFGMASAPTRADEKGEALLRQVAVTVHALEPLTGKYIVTAKGALSHFQGDYSETIHLGGIAWGGHRTLPHETFRLFDPPMPPGAVTRYIGRQTVAGASYEVVEQTQFQYTIRFFIGEDGLIHRARITVAPSAAKLPASAIARPAVTKPAPDVQVAPRVAPSKSGNVDVAEIVVTDYHKVRVFAPRPTLPPPDNSFTFFSPTEGKKRYAYRMGVSPEGALMALLFIDGSAQIVGAAQGSPVSTLDSPISGDVLVFSPDSTRLLANNNAVLRLYDARTGRKLFDLDGGNAQAMPVFSPDGKLLAGVDRGNAILLWDAATGQRLPSILQKGVQKAQFSPDGKRLFSTHQQGARWFLTTWDALAGNSLHELAFPGDWQYSPALSPDGSRLVLSRENGEAAVFDAQTGGKIRDLTEIRGKIHLLQFTDDGKTLFAADWDTRGDSSRYEPGIVVWDTARWEVTFSGSLPPGVFLDPTGALKITPNGKSFAYCGIGKDVRVWNVPSKMPQP